MTPRRDHRRRGSLLVLAAVTAAVVALLVPMPGAGAAVPAQDGSTTTQPPVRDGDSPINDILPEPNSGEAPEHPSDRGGWQQIMVFCLLVGGMGVIALLVVRESRAARRRSAR